MISPLKRAAFIAVLIAGVIAACGKTDMGNERQDYENMRAHTNSAVDFDRAGDYDKAIAELKKADEFARTDTEHMMMQVNLGVMLEKKADLAGAIVAYDRAIEYESREGSYFASGMKAALLFRMGRKSESADLWRRLLQRNDLTDTDRRGFQHNLDQTGH